MALGGDGQSPWAGHPVQAQGYERVVEEFGKFAKA